MTPECLKAVSESSYFIYPQTAILVLVVGVCLGALGMWAGVLLGFETKR